MFTFRASFLINFNLLSKGIAQQKKNNDHEGIKKRRHFLFSENGKLD